MAGGSIADDVEVELALGSSVTSLAVGLRSEMSMLGSLDIPGAPIPLGVLRFITNTQEESSNCSKLTAASQVSKMLCCLLCSVFRHRRCSLKGDMIAQCQQFLQAEPDS